MSIVVAKRYADALFQLANEQKQAETIQKELKTVHEVFASHPKWATMLNHPGVSKDEKVNMIDKVLQKTNQHVVNLIKLLVERNRIDSIQDTIDHYHYLYNEANGIAHATVYSVRSLTDEESKQLELSFKKQLNKKSLTIDNVVDPSIIGGMKIKVGNTIYDGSISGKLNRLKNNLVSVSK